MCVCVYACARTRLHACIYVCVIMLYWSICTDDQDEEATISEQEQMEDDSENVDEVLQLSKEGMCNKTMNVGVLILWEKLLCSIVTKYYSR